MATAAEAGEKASKYYEGMPQIDPAFMPNLIFWFVLTILAIYFILARVAIPRISSTLEERSSAISRDIEQAADLKTRAEEAETAYNDALAKARGEAQKIAAEAKADIQKDLDAAIAKADAEIAARAAESEARIGDIRASADKAVKDVAKTTANEIIKSVMPGAADAKSITAAITAALKG